MASACPLHKVGHSLPASSSDSFTALPASATKLHALLSASTDPVPKPGPHVLGFASITPTARYQFLYLLLIIVQQNTPKRSGFKQPQWILSHYSVDWLGSSAAAPSWAAIHRQAGFTWVILSRTSSILSS